MGSLKNLTVAVALFCVPGLAIAQCGGGFSAFKAGLKTEAVSRGIAAETADAFLAPVRQDQAVLRADRAQGVFQRPFIDFSRRLISQNRIDRGKANARKYQAVFDQEILTSACSARIGVDNPTSDDKRIHCFHVFPLNQRVNLETGQVRITRSNQVSQLLTCQSIKNY